MYILFSLVSSVSVSLNDAATVTAADYGTATATATATADMWRTSCGTSTSTVYAMSMTLFLGLFTCCVAGIQYKIHRMQQIAVRPIFRNTNTNDTAADEDEDDGSSNEDNGTCTSREITIPIAKNGHWLLGHLMVLHKDGDFRNGQYQTCIAQADPRTGLCSMWFLSIPTVSVLLAADVQQVLKGSSYRKSSSWLLTKHQNMLLGPNALVTLMGKEWKYYRTAVHKSFTPLALQESQQIINSVGRTLTQSLLRAIHNNSTSTTGTIEKEGNGNDKNISKSSTNTGTNYYETEVLALMKMATIDVFGLSSLGYDLQSCETLQPSKVATAFDYLTDEFTRRMGKPWNITTWLYQIPTNANMYHAKQQRILRSFIHDLVAKGRQELAQGTTPEDTKKTEFLLTLLKQSAKDEKHPISDTALSDIIMTLLFGGYDTTSITLTYAIYLLTLHPEIEQRVVQEITSVLDQDTEQHHLQKHQELPYTRAVIYETLRLYPPAPVTVRNLEKEMILHETIPIPADTMMYVPIWSIQRDARNFPQPTTFRPDRWVKLDPVTNTYVERFPDDDDDDDDAKNEKHETTHDRSSNYIPAANRDGFCSFSAGARNCVGKVLAMQEAVTILAQLLYKLQFELIAPDYEVQPILSSFIQKPHDGLPMRIKPRERNRNRERETEK